MWYDACWTGVSIVSKKASRRLKLTATYHDHSAGALTAHSDPHPLAFLELRVGWRVQGDAICNPTTGVTHTRTAALARTVGYGKTGHAELTASSHWVGLRTGSQLGQAVLSNRAAAESTIRCESDAPGRRARSKTRLPKRSDSTIGLGIWYDTARFRQIDPQYEHCYNVVQSEFRETGHFQPPMALLVLKPVASRRLEARGGKLKLYDVSPEAAVLSRPWEGSGNAQLKETVHLRKICIFQLVLNRILA